MRAWRGFALGAVIGAVATAAGFQLLCEPSRPSLSGSDTEEDAALGHEGRSPAARLHPASRAAGSADARDGIAFDQASFDREFRRSFAAATGQPPDPEAAEQAWREARALIAESAARATAAAVRRHEVRVREAMVAKRGDVIALLADAERAHLLPAIRDDPRTLEDLFAHRQSGPRVPGPATMEADAPVLAAGTTLDFPAGVWVVDPGRLMSASGHVPIDLTIEGAGMDRTLIRIERIHSPGTVWNLHLRDCTIDSANGGLFDLRKETAGVRAEKVRFVRFDAGDALSRVFYLPGGGAVYCSDCTFAGGFGKAPGKGRVIEGSRLARFERCLFDRVSYNTFEPSTTLYGCTFRDCAGIAAQLKRAAKAPAEHATFVECRVETTMPAGSLWDADALRRDLGKLFPDAR